MQILPCFKPLDGKQHFAMNLSEWKTWTVFDKCTVVACKLQNGFVLVEYSACISPENHDPEIGERNCRDKIINKLWELEGYRLQTEVAKWLA